MTEIAKKIDKGAAQILSQVDADDRSGSSLLAPLRLEEELENVLLWMQGSIRVDNVDAPRFGVLSLILQGTPCYVYGHPALKKVSRTAFTDGVHVFICDDFFDRLNKDADDSKLRHVGIEALLLHELMHKLFHHTRRLREFSPEVANRATDLSINAKLKLGFPDMEWVKTLSETGLSFRAGEAEHYAKLAEETIARELMNEDLRKRQKEKENQKNQPGQGQPGQGQPGQGQPGQGQPGQGQPGQGQPGQGQPGQGQPGQKQPGQGQPGQGQPGQKQPGQGQPGQGQPGQGQPGQGQPGQGQPGQDAGGGDGGEPSDVFSGEGDNHMVDLEALIKILEENGLENVKKQLNLPDSDNMEEIGRIQEADALRQAEAIQQAELQRNQLGSKYPGAHIADSASEFVKSRTKAKMSWRLGLREIIMGEGQKYRYSMEEPADIYYIDEVREILESELYLPIMMPHKNDEVVLCLIDTSGSVHTEDIEAFLAEVFELMIAANSNSDQASEVIVLSADTVLRGDPVQINERNAHELLERGIQIHGRGGTDFVQPCRQAAALPMFKEKKIRAVVYFTDLFAHIPKSLEELGLPEGTAMLYVAAPSTSKESSQVEEFAKGVESYARVVEIKEGVEANLSEEFKDEEVSPKQRRPKP